MQMKLNAGAGGFENCTPCTLAAAKTLAALTEAIAAWIAVYSFFW